MIEAANVSARLGARTVLSGVSLAAGPGEHIVIVGPNGAGKTSLLRVLAGLLAPSAGEVTYSGKRMHDLPAELRARSASYLPQSRELAWDITAGDVAALGLYAWGARRYGELKPKAKAAVDAALGKTGAFEFAARQLSTLSGGEQARVHLARALASNSDALLLDEPCASLDIRHQLELMAALEAERERGKTVITVLHDLRLAERFASRLLVLSGGKIACDIAGGGALPEDVLADVFSLQRTSRGDFSLRRELQ